MLCSNWRRAFRILYFIINDVCQLNASETTKFDSNLAWRAFTRPFTRFVDRVSFYASSAKLIWQYASCHSLKYNTILLYDSHIVFVYAYYEYQSSVWFYNKKKITSIFACFRPYFVMMIFWKKLVFSQLFLVTTTIIF